jgi:nucleotide-binding universal stress UspA family protein
MSDRVLVPMEDNEIGEKTLKYAIETFPKSDITVLNVLQLRGVDRIPGIAAPADDVAKGQLENHAENIFDSAREIAESHGYEGRLKTMAEEGDPEQVIVDMADEFDQVVMGTHGREGREKNLLGSVAETVVRRSPVPVVVVK